MKNNNMINNSLKVRVYFEDTDSAGVVYYANYLKFIERGRTELLRDIGFEQDDLNKKHNIVFAVKSIKADYIYPAKFNNLLEVKTSIEKLGHASIYFLHKIVNTIENKVLFKAHVVVVCLNTDNFKPCIIPINILEAING
jgi:acyl-CoA thioester hydrolase